MAETTIGFIYEHPTWTQHIVEAIRDRGVHVLTVDVGMHRWRTDDVPPVVDIWVNRVNSMPSTGRGPSVVAATGQLLAWLELRGQPVINGAATHRLGSSKALQGALFARLGMDAPAGVVVGRPADAVAAAESIGFPVLIKPNVGGSGVGIRRFDTSAELAGAIAAGSVDLGVDGTGVVQRMIESADGLVYRYELLGAEVLYVTAQPLSTDGFNYCAVDGSGAEESALHLVEADEHVAADAASFMTAAGADVGSVEFILDAATGRPSYFDFNPYSNFIDGFDDQLGFDPTERYIDFVLAQR